MCACVGGCGCVFVWVHTHTHARSVHTHARIACTHARTHTHLETYNMYTHTHTHTHTRMTCIRACMYGHVSTCTLNQVLGGALIQRQRSASDTASDVSEVVYENLRDVRSVSAPPRSSPLVSLLFRPPRLTPFHQNRCHSPLSSCSWTRASPPSLHEPWIPLEYH